MASKHENNVEWMGAQQKHLFLHDMYVKQRELLKRQREYKTVLSQQYKTRADIIVEKGLWNAIDALQRERNQLRAQIWVADGAVHMQENKRDLKEIKCHVDCQENLAKDISKLKVGIGNMERELSRVNREIYDLNCKIVPESQHAQHVAHTRKKLGILENHLEVGVRRECVFIAQNTQLRDKLQHILNNRAQFNHVYTKMVNSLDSDKKYMIDLMEYALNTYENCINVSEKKISHLIKMSKEEESRKNEVQGLMRACAANHAIDEFLSKKAQIREIAPLEPKIVRRRENYCRFRSRRIELYKNVIQKLVQFSNLRTIYEIIDQYQEHESLYYSYFSLDNEREFHITLLTNSVDHLYNNIKNLKIENYKKITAQVESLDELQTKLKERRKRTQELNIMVEKNNKRLSSVLGELHTIMSICKLSISPLLEMLGDHTRVNLENMKRFMRVFEKHMEDLVGHVYVSERANPNITPEKYVVKDIEKFAEPPTKLSDIVLTQQCPECTEGEAFTVDDTGDGCALPLTVSEAKEGLFEKVNQPEMQYRLHSISQCHLPRSRLLAAKRNT